MPSDGIVGAAPPRRPRAEGLWDASGGIYPGWLTVAGGNLGLAVGPSAILVLCFGLFVGPLQREFGWGIPAISLGATIIAYMIIVASLLQGYLIDRFGARRLILLSSPCFSATLAALYFLPNNVAVFYAAWVVISLAAVGVWAVSYLKLTAAWFDRRLGLAVGLTNSGFGLGAFLLPLFAGALIAHYGWRTAYLGLALLSVVIAWPSALFLLKEPSSQAPGTSRRSAVAADGQSFAEAWRTRSFRVMAGAFFLLGLLAGAIVLHQVNILTDAGLPRPLAVTVQSLFGLALIGGRLGAAFLLDRYKASSLMIACVLAAAAACLLYRFGAQYAVAVICAVSMGLLVGAEFDVLGYLVPRYHGRKAFGKITGTIFGAFQLGSGIAAAAVGFSRGYFGSYLPALNVLAALMLVCAALFLLLGPYRFTPATALRGDAG